jgi:8-oxo-dGTP diphosphatase
MSLLVHDCVGALLVRHGTFLLGRRSAGRRWLAEAWDVPGGHIEPGEDAQQALRRELAEELGIVAAQPRYLQTLHGDGLEPWRLQLFAVAAWAGELRNLQPSEHAELRWCSLAEAKDLLGTAHPDFARVLEAALALPAERGPPPAGSSSAIRV